MYMWALVCVCVNFVLWLHQTQMRHVENIAFCYLSLSVDKVENKDLYLLLLFDRNHGKPGVIGIHYHF